MFDIIVVGTDGSATATRAVEEAAQLATDHGAELHIVSAYGMPDETRSGTRLNMGSVEVVLDDAVRIANLAGASAHKHVLDREPGEGIVAIAEELGADLIVVGNRLMRGIQGYFVGSVPAAVLRDAPCSVLVVRTTDGPEAPG
jgi:nucleotide-binding universal stress UspA family protein